MKEVLEEKREYTAEDFIKLYNDIIQETGFHIETFPEYRLRDDGTWSLVLTPKVAKNVVE